MVTKDDLSGEQMAQRRAKYTTGLLWHVGAFIIINGFFWLLDLFVGQDGVQWAPWITAFWGLALLFHILAWLIDGRQVERRLTQHYSQTDPGTAH